MNTILFIIIALLTLICLFTVAHNSELRFRIKLYQLEQKLIETLTTSLLEKLQKKGEKEIKKV